MATKLLWSDSTHYLSIGGLIAAGLDPCGNFLLVLSHAGRGVFAVGSWQRVARDPAPAYPESGQAIGIGPIAGVVVPVVELDYDTGRLVFASPDNSCQFRYAEGTLAITQVAAG